MYKLIKNVDMYVDWLENEVQIGDYIFFYQVVKGSMGRYSGKILEFVDDKYSKVQVSKTDSWLKEYVKREGSIVAYNAFVKVTYKE